jgi:tetratricopeptide (TPR) repeat protein
VGILAMQADQSFDAALKIDPSNWEAQFVKASALAGWPVGLNKGPEVIQQLSSLIDQQETMTPQPQFAQAYVLLGDQYQKAGHLDYAHATWQLGAQKYPNDPTLQKRISNP